MGLSHDCFSLLILLHKSLLGHFLNSIQKSHPLKTAVATWSQFQAFPGTHCHPSITISADKRFPFQITPSFFCYSSLAENRERFLPLNSRGPRIQVSIATWLKKSCFLPRWGPQLSRFTSAWVPSNCWQTLQKRSPARSLKSSKVASGNTQAHLEPDSSTPSIQVSSPSRSTHCTDSIRGCISNSSLQVECIPHLTRWTSIPKDKAWLPLPRLAYRPPFHQPTSLPHTLNRTFFPLCSNWAPDFLWLSSALFFFFVAFLFLWWSFLPVPCDPVKDRDLTSLFILRSGAQQEGDSL